MQIVNTTAYKIYEGFNEAFKAYYESEENISPVSYEDHIIFRDDLAEILSKIEDGSSKDENLKRTLEAISLIEGHMLRVDWSVRMAESLNLIGATDELHKTFLNNYLLCNDEGQLVDDSGSKTNSLKNTSEGFANSIVGQFYKKLKNLSEDKLSEILEDEKLTKYSEVIKRKISFLNVEEQISSAEDKVDNTIKQINRKFNDTIKGYKYNDGEVEKGVTELVKNFTNPLSTEKEHLNSLKGFLDILNNSNLRQVFSDTINNLRKIYQKASTESNLPITELILSGRNTSSENLQIDQEEIYEVSRNISNCFLSSKKKIMKLSDQDSITYHQFITDLYLDEESSFKFKSKEEVLGRVFSLYEDYFGYDFIQLLKESIRDYSITDYPKVDVSADDFCMNTSSCVLPNLVKAAISQKPIFSEAVSFAHEVAHLAVTISNNDDNPPSRIRNYGYNKDGAVNETLSYYMQYSLIDDILAEVADKDNKKTEANLLFYQLKKISESASVIDSGNLIIGMLENESDLTPEVLDKKFLENFEKTKHKSVEYPDNVHLVKYRSQIDHSPEYLVQGLVGFVTPAIYSKLSEKGINEGKRSRKEIGDKLNNIFFSGNISLYEFDSMLKEMGFENGVKDAIQQTKEIVMSKTKRLENLVSRIEKNKFGQLEK